MKRLILLLYIGLYFQGQAQTKYKDIVPMIEGTADDYAMEVLRTFLNTNLDHPAANLRIASFYLKKANQTDALIDYDKLQAYAEQARQKLLKAKLLITEKEVKKHAAYYAWIAQKQQAAEANFAMVNQYMADQKTALSQLQLSLPKVYNSFTRSVNAYSQAAKNFNRISSSYPSLKELYLRYDDTLDKSFTQLKNDYDSCLYFFSRYKSMTDTFAIKGYDQTLTIKPINVFRYDGLVTQINFLTNQVEVWNYAAWVDSVRAVVNSDIKALRQLLQTNEERQNKALQTLEKGGFTKDINVVKVDKSLVFNLLRFDYNNPIVPLIKYKEAKQQLLIEEANSTYFDTAQIDITRKLVYYNKMVYQLRNSDSIISVFKARFNPKRLAKYQGYLTTYYKGIDEASQYMANQKNELKKEWNIYGKLLQEGVSSLKPVDSVGTSVRYRKVNYPLQVKPMDETKLASGTPFTTHILADPNGGYYIAGQYKPNKKINNTQLYLIKLSPTKRVSWFKKYDIQLDSAGADSNQHLAGITLTSEGVALLIYSSHLTSQAQASTVLHVLADGSTKMSTHLATSLFPRAILYNDKQNSFALCFNGNTPHLENSAKNELELTILNSLGEVGWSYSENNIGAFVSLNQIKSGYLISRNSTTVSSTKVLLTKVSDTGAKLSDKLIEVPGNKPISRVYKLNDTSIHLIGDNAYQMINSKLQKIYP